jgi:hypothetical protein
MTRYERSKARQARVVIIQVLVCFCSLKSLAQTEIRGIVRDKNSGHPVDYAYVSVGDMQTVTGPEGEFIFQNIKQDSLHLKISHVSYQDKTETIKVNEGVRIIEITPKLIELKEVVVSAPKKTSVKLGALAKKPSVVYFGHVKGDIKLLKITNENPSPDHYLKRLNYYFVQSKKTLGKGYNGASFYIKIYDLDEATSMPGKELTRNEIKITSKGRNKWMSVDISEFKIPLPEKPFFIGVQFIEERGFQTPSGFTQIEPCFGGTSEFGSEELCYSLHDMKWTKSTQNIMISIETGQVGER